MSQLDVGLLSPLPLQGLIPSAPTQLLSTHTHEFSPFHKDTGHSVRAVFSRNSPFKPNTSVMTLLPHGGTSGVLGPQLMNCENSITDAGGGGEVEGINGQGFHFCFFCGCCFVFVFYLLLLFVCLFGTTGLTVQPTQALNSLCSPRKP